jgi:hypothetical protein
VSIVEPTLPGIGHYRGLLLSSDTPAYRFLYSAGATPTRRVNASLNVSMSVYPQCEATPGALSPDSGSPSCCIDPCSLHPGSRRDSDFLAEQPGEMAGAEAHSSGKVWPPLLRAGSRRAGTELRCWRATSTGWRGWPEKSRMRTGRASSDRGGCHRRAGSRASARRRGSGS